MRLDLYFPEGGEAERLLTLTDRLNILLAELSCASASSAFSLRDLKLFFTLDSAFLSHVCTANSSTFGSRVLGSEPGRGPRPERAFRVVVVQWLSCV